VFTCFIPIWLMEQVMYPGRLQLFWLLVDRLGRVIIARWYINADLCHPSMLKSRYPISNHIVLAIHGSVLSAYFKEPREEFYLSRLLLLQ